MAQQIKKLDDAGLKKLQSLENKLGCCIVALERQLQPAALSQEQVQELRAAEREMNSILVAYDCEKTPGVTSTTELRDARQFLEAAIEIEQNGYKFYESAAQGKNEEARNVLIQLAEREREHEHTFRDMLTRLGGYLSKTPCEDFQYVKALADSSVFTGKEARGLLSRKTLSELETLEAGIGFEKDSILLYTELMGLVPAEDRLIMDEIIGEEKNHLNQLTSLASKIQSGQKVEAAKG